MKKGLIEELNDLLKKFQEKGEKYENHIGQGVSIGSIYGKILKEDIPQKLKELFPEDTYKIKGSIGSGRIAKCPWLAIMNKNETTSTQSGVYLVFLFSRDLQKIYLSLAQGVTDVKEDAIIKKRDEIRNVLQLKSDLLLHFNDQEIDSREYKASAIYSNEWDCNDNGYCEKLITEEIKAYEMYMQIKTGTVATINSSKSNLLAKKHNISFSIKTIIEYINQTGLIYSDNLIKRFAFSLLTKPFVILSGLAGSGKTQLALAFASALVKDKEKQMCVVSVGADWTNREPLLGFPNALQPGQYVKPESGVLDLLIEANKNTSIPFFLILDEMNMSYVERYFADFLSSLESHEPIRLWDNIGKDVPASISLPPNLFIIGTINVDETTYMFSPKVLDRANVIEFKISVEDMEGFLQEMKTANRSAILNKASDMATEFVNLAKIKDISKNPEAADKLKDFFKELKSVNAEFGYRSATEIFRFICNVEKNDETVNGNKLTQDEILDAAIVQKLLPKLHGSRKKLEPVLQSLWKLCFKGPDKDLQNITEKNVKKAVFKDSADKIRRMYESANANGFTSFAEA